MGENQTLANPIRFMRKITLPLQHTNVTETNGNLRWKRASCLKRWKMGVAELQLVLVLHLIGWKGGRFFFFPTNHRAKANSMQHRCTIDTRLKAPLNWIHKITIKPRTIFQRYRLTLPLKFNVKRYVYHTCWQCQLWADGWQSLDILMTGELKTQFWTQFPEHCHIPLGYEE